MGAHPSKRGGSRTRTALLVAALLAPLASATHWDTTGICPWLFNTFEISDGTVENTYYLDDRDEQGLWIYQESNGVYDVFADMHHNYQSGGALDWPLLGHADPCVTTLSAGPDTLIFADPALDIPS